MSDAKWISRELGITLAEAKAAIERLKKLEMLEEVDGKLLQTVGTLFTPTEIPSDVIKKYHQQMLQKAERALFDQEVDQRDFSSILLTMSKEDLEWAKAEIKTFRRALMERLESNPNKKEIYCLNVQLFDARPSRPNAAKRNLK